MCDFAADASTLSAPNGVTPRSTCLATEPGRMWQWTLPTAVPLHEIEVVVKVATRQASQGRCLLSSSLELRRPVSEAEAWKTINGQGQIEENKSASSREPVKLRDKTANFSVGHSHTCTVVHAFKRGPSWSRL